jgi:hypothetical protein
MQYKEVFFINILFLFLLFTSWLVLKIMNATLSIKLNDDDIYDKIKGSAKVQKIPKRILTSFIISAIISGFACVFLFVILILTMFADDSAKIVDNIFIILASLFYITSALFFLRIIFVNVFTYKGLKDKELIDYLKAGSNQFNNRTNCIGTLKIKKGKFFNLISYILIITTCIIPLFSSANKLNEVKSTSEYSNNNEFLHEIVKPAMNINMDMTPNWYFFHDSTLYAYIYEEGKDNLYAVTPEKNSYTTNYKKKLLLTDDELRYAEFFMVYDNEVFYYTPYYRGVKALNLSTKEIRDVVKDRYLYLMLETLKDGKVTVNSCNCYIGKSHSYFATLDLKTGELTNEKKLGYAADMTTFYNKDNHKAYYILSDDGRYDIYEDNEVIYTYDMTNVNNSNSKSVFVQDKYVFAIIGDKFLKIDPTSRSLIEEQILDTSLVIIPTSHDQAATSLDQEETSMSVSTLPVLSSEGGIYKFNPKDMSFRKIIDTGLHVGMVQEHNGFYIFQSDGHVFLYSNILNEYKEFNSANFTAENGTLYMINYEGDFYDSESEMEINMINIKKDANTYKVTL